MGVPSVACGQPAGSAAAGLSLLYGGAASARGGVPPASQPGRRTSRRNQSGHVARLRAWLGSGARRINRDAAAAAMAASAAAHVRLRRATQVDHVLGGGSGEGEDEGAVQGAAGGAPVGAAAAAACTGGGGDPGDEEDADDDDQVGGLRGVARARGRTRQRQLP